MVYYYNGNVKNSVRGGSMTIFEMLVKTLITFVTLYILCRLLGKKLISQMTFFDFVAGVTIGSISASFLFSTEIAIPVGLSCLIFFVFLALIFDFGTLKLLRFRKVANGEPAILIQNGLINEREMAKARLTMNELQFLLRKKNAFYLDQVNIAILETDGTLSVLKKAEEQPLTKKEAQTHLFSFQRGLTYTVVIDGKIDRKVLQQSGKDEEWLRSELKAKGIKDISQLSIVQVDYSNRIYFDIKDEL